ncbi:hypothetical protein [Cryobacterium sp. Y57]|uniref:hypothetical protein n=1 Tax=Cryobacterium sp. Y57 TaxID=2048287 RepID=UPI000CE39A1D|nr:hypothetical protein [Cryobacterium sp. Y57]
MTQPRIFTVNLISGLPGAGKSSIVRGSGATSLSLAGSGRSAVSEVIASITRSDVMLEIHPSAVPIEVTVSVIAAVDDGALRPRIEALRLGSLVSGLDASTFWEDLRSDARAPIPAVSCLTYGENDRTIADALVEQIEWASVVVINKTDLSSAGSTIGFEPTTMGSHDPEPP